MEIALKSMIVPVSVTTENFNQNFYFVWEKNYRFPNQPGIALFKVLNVTFININLFFSKKYIKSIFLQFLEKVNNDISDLFNYMER